MGYIKNKAYHILETTKGTMFIDKSTNLVVKWVSSRSLEKREFIQVGYDTNKRPADLRIIKVNGYYTFIPMTKNITYNVKKKFIWCDGDGLLDYSDNLGNWYNRDVFDMDLPYETDLEYVQLLHSIALDMIEQIKMELIYYGEYVGRDLYYLKTGVMNNRIEIINLIDK